MSAECRLVAVSGALAGLHLPENSLSEQAKESIREAWGGRAGDLILDSSSVSEALATKCKMNVIELVRALHSSQVRCNSENFRDEDAATFEPFIRGNGDRCCVFQGVAS